MNTHPDPRDALPVRDGTSLVAFLHILKKAHAALVGHDTAHRRSSEIVTRGQARQYIEELMPALLHARDAHRRRRHAKKHH
ncbi:hypothetical protein [Burkholderia pseudomultivorans]|uniref:Uncharacterized protein n=1 Tax=Burkholderia pseudomultivorans TaxID=1207504 RepID=A0ABU2E8I8_9BURK|nr:hypothetical protein [Burkholderia pseudomultivorans]MDR8726294.1 hypothetical protein [Burkholderia pseudomultivorans]MDR8733518.1 hypothetical protein [Burkholderia pseudomultivorans]MDR8740044.1 hypothetical protein [Burkholderia pseudomultivorans]MDR8756193.1 hypothetical protein [Burkholderia pseudomultivorans]MDR8776683.1 hypothetical protein [Burkholderia pseudomultivorans]